MQLVSDLCDVNLSNTLGYTSTCISMLPEKSTAQAMTMLSRPPRRPRVALRVSTTSGRASTSAA